MRQLLAIVVLVVVSAPSTRAQSDATVYRPGNGVTLPVVERQVNPEYTNEARAQRIEGVVGLSCVVRPDGTVTDVEVTESLDAAYGLDRQAIVAMGQWRFKPGAKDGTPVAVKIDVKMNFTLR